MFLNLLPPETADYIVRSCCEKQTILNLGLPGERRHYIQVVGLLLLSYHMIQKCWKLIYLPVSEQIDILLPSSQGLQSV